MKGGREKRHSDVDLSRTPRVNDGNIKRVCCAERRTLQGRRGAYRDYVTSVGPRDSVDETEREEVRVFKHEAKAKRLAVQIR
jgi:hypothetical protein